MGEDLEARLATVRRDALSVDGDDKALGAELLGCGPHQVPVLHRGSVDRHLVGAGLEQSMHVLCATHSASDGERHETALRGAVDHFEYRAALLVARGDVEETKLIGASLVVSRCSFDRIARVFEIDEVDALDDAPLFHVEAGYDADLQHNPKGISGCLAPALGEPAQEHDGGCNRPQHKEHNTGRNGQIGIPDGEAKIVEGLSVILAADHAWD